MDMKAFEQAKKLKIFIEGEERNIKGWEQLFDAKEITLSSATNPQKMYLTGKRIEEVKEIITFEHRERLAKYKREFEEL